MEKDKHLGLRIDSETHEKLKSLAEYEGRSINGEVLYLIRQAIAQHEQEKGTLKFSQLYSIYHTYIQSSNLFNCPNHLTFPPFHIVPTACTVDFEIPNCFAVCLTVALFSII